MKRVIEITAKSHEEARAMAQKEVRMGETITASDVLQEPTRGIFGIVGNPDVRIRFTIDDLPAPQPAPQPAPPPVATVAPRPRQDTYEAPESDDIEESDVADLDEDIAEEAEDIYVDEEMPAETPQQGGGRKPRVYNGPTGKNHPDYEQIIKLVHDIAELVGSGEIEVAERIDGDAWVIEPAGENLMSFIGKHGRTLDAIQYLVNIVANKGREDKVKIVLDAQGYRDSRHRRLISLAQRMCRKVADGGRPVELEPMSTVDRRTIHLALKDRTDIQTYSRGIEPMRRVVIAPRKGANAGNRGRGGPRPPRRFNGPGRPPVRRESEPNTQGGQNGPRPVPMFMGEEGDND